jgi:hypothetical protein
MKRGLPESAAHHQVAWAAFLQAEKLMKSARLLLDDCLDASSASQARAAVALVQSALPRVDLLSCDSLRKPK